MSVWDNFVFLRCLVGVDIIVYKYINMVDRIKKVIEYSQLSSSAFADTIGISRSGLAHLLTGRNQPSLDVARKVLAQFPEISTEWLIMGMGDMFRSEEQTASPTVASEPQATDKAYPAENSKNDRQTDLFGEFENAENSGKDESSDIELISEEVDDIPEVAEPSDDLTPTETVVAAPGVQAVPARVRKSSEDRQSQAPAKRERRMTNPVPEKKLQKIVFFYDDHSFEVYNNI